MSGEDVGTIVLPPPAQRQSRKVGVADAAGAGEDIMGSIIIRTD
jgi:hypothetical protein